MKTQNQKNKKLDSVSKPQNTYFAVVAKGLEEVCAKELKDLGAKNIEVRMGGVHFSGGIDILYKSNLWLRTASRILVQLKEFAAHHPEMLYDQVRRIKWTSILTPEMTFAIDCVVSHAGGADRTPERLRNSQFAALKIKDALVDEMRRHFDARPNVDTEKPDVRIHAYLNQGRCTISLDASGRSLHERGYRQVGHEAPLKETLAAGILLLTKWTPDQPFVDLMCGSGSFCFEAALIALNIAPQIFNPRFGFQNWLDYDEDLWLSILGEAQVKAQSKSKKPIIGYDRDPHSINRALQTAKVLGLGRVIHFEKRELNDVESLNDGQSVVMVNPPYGERMGNVDYLDSLYERLGDTFKQKFKGSSAYLFAGNLELLKKVGLKTTSRKVLYNGPIECRLAEYKMY